jgi:hypothetical protein
MIEMSPFTWVLAGGLSLGVAGCSSSTASCVLIACPDGLFVNIEGGRIDAGSGTYQIDVDTLTPTGERVALIACVLTRAPGSPTLECTSSIAHSESGTSIQIRDPLPTNIVVVVSRDGMKLTELPFRPSYTHQVVPGEGCGSCTHASVTVNIPE